MLYLNRMWAALALLVSSIVAAIAATAKRVRARVAFVLGIVGLAVFASPTAAFAAGAEDGDLITPFNLDWIALLRMLVIPVLLPALVGLINRATPGNWPAFTKRLMLAVAALAQSIGIEFLAAYDHQQPYDLWGALFTGVVAYAVAELTYQGLYKLPITTPSETTGEHVALEPVVTLASAINGTTAAVEPLTAQSVTNVYVTPPAETPVQDSTAGSDVAPDETGEDSVGAEPEEGTLSARDRRRALG